MLASIDMGTEIGWKYQYQSIGKKLVNGLTLEVIDTNQFLADWQILVHFATTDIAQFSYSTARLPIVPTGFSCIHWPVLLKVL